MAAGTEARTGRRSQPMDDLKWQIDELSQTLNRLAAAGAAKTPGLVLGNLEGLGVPELLELAAIGAETEADKWFVKQCWAGLDPPGERRQSLLKELAGYKTFAEIEDESFDEFFGPNGPTENAKRYLSL